MKSLVKLAVAGVVVPFACQASIRWQTTTLTAAPFPAAAITDNTSTPLLADPGPGVVGGTGNYEGIGYFVQLIWAGPDGTANPINLGTFVPGTSIGTEGTDDVVIDTAFIGRGRTTAGGTATNPHGHIINQGAPEPVAAGSTGARYYIRAFNAPVEAGRLFDDSALAPVAGGGLRPSASATFYGNSNVFTSADPLDANAETFTATPFATSLALIPEPTTAGLLGLGLVGLRMAVRRRRQS